MNREMKKKQSLNGWIRWLILFGICVLLYILTDSQLPGLLLLFLLVYLGISAFLAGCTGKKLVCSLRREEDPKKEGCSTIFLTIENQSVLPVVFGTMILEAENVLMGRKETVEQTFSLMPKAGRTFSFAAGDSHCGCIRIRVVQVKISDPLSVFGSVQRVSGKIAFYQLPAVSEVALSRETLSSYDMESYVYSSEKKGDDPSETFGLRSYQPGDSMKTIHWKLSGKMDELMIREWGLPVENRVMMILDMRRRSANGLSPDQIQRMVELFVSLSYTAAKLGMAHTVGWFQAEKGQFESYRICQTGDVFQMLPALLESPVREDVVSAADHFLASDLDKNFSTYLYVTIEALEEETERLDPYGKVTVYRA